MTQEQITVHNAWAVYGFRDDGSRAEEPIAEHRRPQDWGDPRWIYHRFVFTWQTAPDGVHYTNVCHCWTDLQMEPGEYAKLFGGLAAEILMPGTPPELCCRDYLEEEDFWDRKWGKKPKVYEEPEE